MVLICLILLPLLGGLAAWGAGYWNPRAARWTALAAQGAQLALALAIWPAAPLAAGARFLEFQAPWIPRYGIQIHLGIDGLSYLLVLLTAFLGLLGVACSWTEIRRQVGFFHFHLLAVVAGITGVFLALDLFLFFFCWELMLVPMYFLVLLWGHENRVYASFKLFLFTQSSGLLMLLSILGLYLVHGRATGTYTFDYDHLLGTPLGTVQGAWLMLGFFAAFAVKLPMLFVHNWLPDAHTEAPTAGSLLLAGLLLKTGAYGLLRFLLPLFPEAVPLIAGPAQALGVAGILYGAVLAFGQTDLKRLVAYTSVSHMGFVLLGVFSGSFAALQGVVLQLVCHGLSTGALFILVGALYERTHTRDLGRLAGLWPTVPRMGALAMVFAMASLGLPGLGNFVAEFLILSGSFRGAPFLTAGATLGLVAATAYSLRIVLRVFHGPDPAGWKIPDLGIREMAVALALVAALVGVGLFPQPLLRLSEPASRALCPPPAGTLSAPPAAQIPDRGPARPQEAADAAR